MIMQSSLQRLLISMREFSQLSGLRVLEPETNDKSDRPLLVAIGGSVVGAFGLFGIASQLLHNPLLDIGLGISPLVLALGWIAWRKQTIGMSTVQLNAQSTPEAWALYTEVVNFNKIVRSLDVSDQLQQVGNPGLSNSVRQKLLKALQLVRQDLVRAIQTERILRENQDVIEELFIHQSELFTNNLASLQALQLESQAADVEQYLTSAVQIALDVRDRLQDLRD